MRMEMDVAHRSHGHAAGLERPPFAPDHPHLRLIDGLAENGPGKLDFTLRQGAGGTFRVQAFTHTETRVSCAIAGERMRS